MNWELCTIVRGETPACLSGLACHDLSHVILEKAGAFGVYRIKCMPQKHVERMKVFQCRQVFADALSYRF
ncbi:hypothetical protein, partial [Listeria monocytogenes]|uniref:hypothetical protein n=1 Tax=Listeria monocytogenes TaxID=1639 RepID=UPI003F6749D7